MTSRAPALQAFLSSVHDAIASSHLDRLGSEAIGRIYAALDTPGSPGSGKARRLAVVDGSLPAALDAARRHSGTMARIADAFQAVEPSLYWAPRSASGPHASVNWPEGHANAMIVGPGGVESRNDLQIGVSLHGASRPLSRPQPRAGGSLPRPLAGTVPARRVRLVRTGHRRNPLQRAEHPARDGVRRGSSVRLARTVWLLWSSRPGVVPMTDFVRAWGLAAKIRTR